MKPLEELQQLVNRLEPDLRRTIWPPMSYMLIPGLLSTADRVIEALRDPEWAGNPKAEKLLKRIIGLRADFRRDA